MAILATDPFLSQTKPQLEQFEESSDGKLIIKDAENDVVDVSYFGNVESVIYFYYILMTIMNYMCLSVLEATLTYLHFFL